VAVSNEKKGDVVGTGCGAAYYVQLYVVVSGKGRETFIKSLLDHILLEHDKASASDDTVTRIYQFNVKQSYWDCTGADAPRPMNTVVLDDKYKTKLLTDVKDFLAKDTASFYKKHGVPYRRGYLFYGPPGTGKTSMVRALAGVLKKKLMYSTF